MKPVFAVPILLLTIGISPAVAQAQTVGVLQNNTARTSPGYVLLDPLHNGRTYLIDNNGQTINSWLSKYEPGRMAYLLPNGHLLRAAMMLSGLSTGGGEGGRLEEYDWAGNMVWSFDYASPTYSLHHDFKYLPNGNILALLVEVKTSAQMLAAGFRPDILQPGGDGSLQPDAVVEIQPVGTSGGVIVWEWHAWHHLIQNFDSSRSNYGTPSAHPELIDPNASYPRKIASFWNHMNGLDYNPDLDQIMLSVRGNSEVWVIDHSTTKAQSAGHTGGKYGKGGDLLYRWGNPVMYGAGKAADEILYQQHDTQWIEPGSPGPGHILVFNNGVGRPAGAYSSVDEFAPPLDSAGNYTLATGAAYGPTQLFWTYAGSGANQYYDGDISGAQRLPNGNTLITYGTHGLLVEVTSGGDIVWKYSNPVVLAGPLTQGQTPPVDVKNENMNAVFKVRKYAPGYLGLVGKDLTPHGLLELYSARSVNAASFLAGSAPAGSIVAMFADTALADSPSAAPSSTLPVKLGGTSVSVTDSAGVSRPASLYYVSPGQINFVMPDGCATGKATVNVVRDSGAGISGAVIVEPFAPGLFTLGSAGIGAIIGLRVSATNEVTDVPVFAWDSAKSQFTALPIDLGAATDQVYLSLYGTGIRGFSALSNIKATVAGVSVPVQAAAAHSVYPGMDQVNLGPLPRGLAGKGLSSIVLSVDARTANSVTVNFK